MAADITISITDSELQRAVGRVKSWETKKIKRVGDVVQETTINIERKAKEKYVPVISGNLKSSIHHSLTKDRLSGIVQTNVVYANSVEFGGVNGQKKKPYMRPAAMSEQRSYIAKLRQALKSA